MKLARETEMRESHAMRLDMSNEDSKSQIPQSDLSIVFSQGQYDNMFKSRRETAKIPSQDEQFGFDRDTTHLRGITVREKTEMDRITEASRENDSRTSGIFTGQNS